MNSTLILTIVLLVVVALVVVNYLNKKHIRYNPSDLQKSTQKILEKQAGKPITKANFLIELKRTYRCSHKERHRQQGSHRLPACAAVGLSQAPI